MCNEKSNKKLLQKLVISSFFVLFFVNIAVADDLQKSKIIKRIPQSTSFENQFEDFRDVIHRYDYRPKKVQSQIRLPHKEFGTESLISLINEDLRKKFLLELLTTILVNEKAQSSTEFFNKRIVGNSFNNLRGNFIINNHSFNSDLLYLRGGKFDLKNIKKTILPKIQKTKTIFKEYFNEKINPVFLQWLIYQKQKSKVLVVKETLAIIIVGVFLYQILRNRQEIKEFVNYYIFSSLGRNEIIEKTTDLLFYVNDFVSEKFPESKSDKKRSFEIKKLYRYVNRRMRQLLKNLRDSHTIDETLDNFSQYQNQRERFRYLNDVINEQLKTDLEDELTIEFKNLRNDISD